MLRQVTTTAPSSDMSDAERKMADTATQFRRQLITMVASVDFPGRMVIRLQSLDKMEGSRDDIYIEDGDALSIPATPSQVRDLERDYDEMQVMLFGAAPEFDNILEELELSYRILRDCGAHLGGVHFELTGENVTESTSAACPSSAILNSTVSPSHSRIVVS